MYDLLVCARFTHTGSYQGLEMLTFHYKITKQFTNGIHINKKGRPENPKMDTMITNTVNQI